MEAAESLCSVRRWSNHECMNGLVIGPETELQSTPVVHYGEAPPAQWLRSTPRSSERGFALSLILAVDMAN